MLSTPVARDWLVESGVHCYAPEGFNVHASRELVSITASNAQTVTLHWPEKVRVEDWLTGWTREGAEIECPFEVGQTRLFHVTRAG
jgi:hypothetical protein